MPISISACFSKYLLCLLTKGGCQHSSDRPPNPYLIKPPKISPTSNNGEQTVSGSHSNKHRITLSSDIWVHNLQFTDSPIPAPFCSPWNIFKVGWAKIWRSLLALEESKEHHECFEHCWKLKPLTIPTSLLLVIKLLPPPFWDKEWDLKGENRSFKSLQVFRSPCYHIKLPKCLPSN